MLFIKFLFIKYFFILCIYVMLFLFLFFIFLSFLSTLLLTKKKFFKIRVKLLYTIYIKQQYNYIYQI